MGFLSWIFQFSCFPFTYVSYRWFCATANAFLVVSLYISKFVEVEDLNFSIWKKDEEIKCFKKYIGQDIVVCSSGNDICNSAFQLHYEIRVWKIRRLSMVNWLSRLEIHTLDYDLHYTCLKTKRSCLYGL